MKTKIILNTNRQALPVVCLLLLFGIFFIFLAILPYLQIYVFHTAAVADGRADAAGSYLSSHGTNETTTKYVSYYFSADGVSYTGSDTCLRNYSPGTPISVIYHIDNPKKNSRMRLRTELLFFGFVVTAFCLRWLFSFFHSFHSGSSEKKKGTPYSHTFR